MRVHRDVAPGPRRTAGPGECGAHHRARAPSGARGHDVDGYASAGRSGRRGRDRRGVRRRHPGRAGRPRRSGRAVRLGGRRRSAHLGVPECRRGHFRRRGPARVEAERIAVESRVQRVNPVHRVQRVDPVDRLERVDPVDRVGVLDRLGVLRVLCCERAVAAVGGVLAVGPSLAIELEAVPTLTFYGFRRFRREDVISCAGVLNGTIRTIPGTGGRTVRAATSANVQPLAAVMARAFHDDPPFI